MVFLGSWDAVKQAVMRAKVKALGTQGPAGLSKCSERAWCWKWCPCTLIWDQRAAYASFICLKQVHQKIHDAFCGGRLCPIWGTETRSLILIETWKAEMKHTSHQFGIQESVKNRKGQRVKEQELNILHCRAASRVPLKTEPAIWLEWLIRNRSTKVSGKESSWYV